MPATKNTKFPHHPEKPNIPQRTNPYSCGTKATLTPFSFKINDLRLVSAFCQCVSVRALTKINDTFFF